MTYATRLATLYEFGDCKIREFIGDIYDYLESKQVENMREFEKSFITPSTKNGNSPTASQTQQNKQGKSAPSQPDGAQKSAPALSSQEWFAAKKELEKDEKKTEQEC